MFVVAILMIFSSTKVIIAQASYLQVGTAVSPYINGDGNLLVGNGFTSSYTTYSKLHVKSTSGFTSQSLFGTEVWCFGSPAGSILNLVRIGYQNYGIYQTSLTSSNLLNYFQDPVKMGTVTIGGSGNTGAVNLDRAVTSLDFKFNPGLPPSDAVTPLSINVLGIRVKSNLVTDHFQMKTGAGSNKILISDDTGNAYWINPPNGGVVPWLVTDNNDIVSNRELNHVGIGTTEPKYILDISHSDPRGGISMNQILDDNTNGSAIMFNKNSVPQFSMGHGYFNERSSFFIWSALDTIDIPDNKGGGKMELFMDIRNGMTGLGTEWPNAKLEVAGDMIVKTKLGIGCIPPDDNLYKLFVEGGIMARDIKVTINTFRDYCFADDYNLMSIPDLSQYIAAHKHLPGLPSAKEVADNNGFQLGDMQLRLVEKVEEQSLYILQLQKQIDELKKLMESLIKK